MQVLTLRLLLLVALLGGFASAKSLRETKQVELHSLDENHGVGLPDFLIKDSIMGDKHAELYLKAGMAGPRPPGLYRHEVLKKSTHSFHGVDPIYRQRFVPNVQFFEPKEYRSKPEDSSVQWKYDPEKGDDKLRVAMKVFTTEVKGSINAKSSSKTKKITAPTMGAIALNDCARWSQFMMWLLVKLDKQKSSLTAVATKLDPGKPKRGVAIDKIRKLKMPRVSDTFHLKYRKGHHGITVVLATKDYFITLEAHASKDLRKPYFHSYTSMDDFVEKNFNEERQQDSESRVYLIYPTLGFGVGEGALDGYVTLDMAKKNSVALIGLIKHAESDEVLFDGLQTPITRAKPEPGRMSRGAMDGSDGKMYMIKKTGKMSHTFLPALYQ